MRVILFIFGKLICNYFSLRQQLIIQNEMLLFKAFLVVTVLAERGLNNLRPIYARVINPVL